MSVEYRYQNAYPAGPCTLPVRGELVPHGEWSSWGSRVDSGTRELDRGWLLEEERAIESEAKHRGQAKKASKSRSRRG